PRPGYGFCKLVPSGPDRGKLIVTVKNQGRANAPASKTTVEFTPGGGIKIPTPAIPAGSSVALPPVAIPAAAWQPDAHFKIRVNSDAKVDESNNNNNTGTGPVSANHSEPSFKRKIEDSLSLSLARARGGEPRHCHCRMILLI